MITNYEYEIKMMLNQVEYNRLHSMGEGAEHLQINHYFDTPDFLLYKSFNVVRIRQLKGIYELTIKQSEGKSSPPDVLSVNETSYELNENTAIKILEGKSKINEYLSTFPNLSNKNLNCIGGVTTLRKLLKLSKDMPKAELDKSTYLGKTDYELEWEIESHLYGKASLILEEHGISALDRESGKSKYKRFINRLWEERF